MEEEIKTNIFLESKENKPTENLISNENENENEETYNTLEEYFLDVCRDGFSIIKIFFLNPNKIRDITEFKDCIENQVDIFCCDRNLNTPLRIFISKL